MRGIHRLAVLLVAAALGCAASTAAAQVEGTVRGPGGAPLPGAAVEVWGGGERLASTVSDGQGRFRFPRERAEGVDRLTVRLVGHAPLAMRARPGGPALHLVLRELPVALPELAVRAARRHCPNRETPAARAVWAAAAARYSRETERRGFDALRLRVEETRSGEEVGRFAEERMRRGRIWSGDHPGRLRLDSIVEASGYARPLDWRRPGYQPPDPVFLAWRYPFLQARDAHHFVSEAFGRLHTFSVISQDAQETVLMFCPRARSARPSVEGTLVVGADTTFSSATWAFRTPSPDEQAGGEVTFGSVRVEGDEHPHLVATQGIFWRRLAGSRRFFQQAEVFPVWVVGPDERRPELRLRASHAGF